MAEAHPKRVAQLQALLAAHNARQAEPMWPGVFDGPQLVDKTVNEPYVEGDEYSLLAELTSPASRTGQAPGHAPASSQTALPNGDTRDFRPTGPGSRRTLLGVDVAQGNALTPYSWCVATDAKLLAWPHPATNWWTISTLAAITWHRAACVEPGFAGTTATLGKTTPTAKDWLVDRLTLLARCFAVEIYGYAVMSNHFHVVLHYDPKACESWTAEEVAERWVDAFPPTERGAVVEERKAEARALLLDDPEQLEHARRTLGSLSAFMKHLKQPIARRANLEDGCEGHFFEQRFYSGALLSEDAHAGCDGVRRPQPGPRGGLPDAWPSAATRRSALACARTVPKGWQTTSVQ